MVKKCKMTAKEKRWMSENFEERTPDLTFIEKPLCRSAASPL